MKQRRILLCGVMGATLCIAAQGAAEAATIRIVNLDGPNEGFNDRSAWAPRGGNPAITLGGARLNAFRYAAEILGRRLQSDVDILVDAQMDLLQSCGARSAVLGQAGPNTIHENFLGGEYGYTWYPQALANALAGVDLAPSDSDIFSVFNTGVDTAFCLGTTDWYYCFDGQSRLDIDFVSVVLHELAHGLGFVSLVDPSTGAKFLGQDDVFSRLLQNKGAVPSRFIEMSDAQRAAAVVADPNLHWIGWQTNETARRLLDLGMASGHVQMNGPNPFRPGSSVSHFSPQLWPNQIMEPSYGGVSHDPTLEVAALADMGWDVVSPMPLLGARGTLALTALLLLLAGILPAALHARALTRERGRA
jgi:hypothetical protein